MNEDDTEVDYLSGRNGDHLLTPFQCELCHFRNLYGREPDQPRDTWVLGVMRRALLDAFWDRSRATVEANVRILRRMLKDCEELGLPPPQMNMGPWALEDTVGMGVAVLLLKRSLDPGRNDKYVQYDTVRKLRSAATNLYQAGVNGLKDRVASFEKQKLWISEAPTQSYWFTRFMGGFHKRVGQTKRQDFPIQIITLKKLQDMWEAEWDDQGTVRERLITSTEATWFLVGFCCGLRGEEMVQIEESGTRESMTNEHARLRHFEIVVSGPTKGNRLMGTKFRIPCVWETEASKLKPGLWLKRFLATKMEGLGRKPRLFQFTDDKPTLKDCHEIFYGTVDRGRARSIEGLKDKDEAGETYGIRRSLRRGVTTHALNVGISKDLLASINRWRLQKESRTGAPRLDMVDLYAELDTLKPLFLEFSRKL